MNGRRRGGRESCLPACLLTICIRAAANIRSFEFVHSMPADGVSSQGSRLDPHLLSCLHHSPVLSPSSARAFMSRRSANLSRFAGTSHSAEGGFGHPEVDDGAYPLRPLSRNRSARASWIAAGTTEELSGGSNEDSFLRATPRPNQQNGSGQRKPNNRRKSRLSDADQEDGYLSSGTGDGQEEQDHLLLSSAGVEGAWPIEHTTNRQTEPGSSVCSEDPYGLCLNSCWLLRFVSPRNRPQRRFNGKVGRKSATSHGRFRLDLEASKNELVTRR